MSNFHGMKCWAVCWLGLVALLLVPSESFAEPREGFQHYTEDPICYRSSFGICQKWRIAVVGAGILSTEGASAAAGMKLGYAWVIARRVELGADLLYVKDLRIDEGPELATAEGILRFATIAGPNHRAFLQFGLGVSRYESPEDSYFAFPCASAGGAFELAGQGVGVFLTGGVSLMWAEGLAALPHAGVGVVF